jgi:hypothetical protein
MSTQLLLKSLKVPSLLLEVLVWPTTRRATIAINPAHHCRTKLVTLESKHWWKVLSLLQGLSLWLTTRRTTHPKEQGIGAVGAIRTINDELGNAHWQGHIGYMHSFVWQGGAGVLSLEWKCLSVIL